MRAHLPAPVPDPRRPVTVSRTRTAVTTALLATRPVRPVLRGLVRSATGCEQTVAAGATHLGVPSTGTSW